MKRIFQRLRHGAREAASGFAPGIALCLAVGLAAGFTTGTAFLAGCRAFQAPAVQARAAHAPKARGAASGLENSSEEREAATTGGESRLEEPAPFRLLLMHVNDTHSKLEPSQVKLSVDLGEPLGRKPVYVELGGFPRVWAAAERTRAAGIGTLFLHAGDAFQGTLYFTRFGGKADAEFFNAMGVDAMVPGNHEFDKGPQALRGFLELVRFPVLSSNLDFSREPELVAGALKPYVIEAFDGSRVAVVGITTPETPYISSPGPNLVFADQTETAARCVVELQREGVNKIVVLSHLGYREDLELASSVEGIDVIVGGHSHTLLGSFSDLGLPSSGEYPSVVRGPGGDTVLVVTAWEWAKVMGELEVGFDANGRVSDWSGTPRLVAGTEWFRVHDLPGSGGKPVRVEFRKDAKGPNVGDPNAAGASLGIASAWTAREYDGNDYTVVPDTEQSAHYLEALDRLIARLSADERVLLVEAKPEGLEMLERYGVEVEALKKQVAAHAAEELRRGNNRGPGPLIADSMIAKTGARIAVMNPGGVRTNLGSGPVSVAQVYELQPFGNTLVTLDLTGAGVVNVLEDMCDFTVSRYEKSRGTAYVYVAGLRFTLFVNAPKGRRVRNVEVRDTGGAYEPLETARVYKTAVNSFMASGGDKNDTLKEAPGKYDTGYVDSEATLEYLNGKTLVNRSEERVRQIF
jgi:5'-nucleotidase/UDP-sugar diphosphatase